MTDSPSTRALSAARGLRAIAWAGALAHVAGLALAATGMRPGTPLVTLDERLSYLAGRPLGWSLGWGTWMVCALALVAFYFAAAERSSDGDSPRGLVWLALTIAIAAAAIDLCCDTLYITVLPDLAAAQLATASAAAPSAATAFLALERGVGACGVVVANGLYSLAGAVMVVALRRRPHMRLATLLGVAVAVCGGVMVIAGFAGSARLLELATGPTIGAYCAWSLAVAYALTRERER